MFTTRKHTPDPTMPAPVAPDADVEPPKAGPDGMITASWQSWEWRQAERRLERANAAGRLTYPPEVTARLVKAQRERDDAALGLDRLLAERDRLHNAAREAAARRSIALASGYGDLAPPPDDALAKIERMVPDVAERLRKSESALLAISGPADADLAARRAEVIR